MVPLRSAARGQAAGGALIFAYLWRPRHVWRAADPRDVFRLVHVLTEVLPSRRVVLRFDFFSLSTTKGERTRAVDVGDQIEHFLRDFEAVEVDDDRRRELMDGDCAELAAPRSLNMDGRSRL